MSEFLPDIQGDFLIEKHRLIADILQHIEEGYLLREDVITFDIDALANEVLRADGLPNASDFAETEDPEGRAEIAKQFYSARAVFDVLGLEARVKIRDILTVSEQLRGADLTEEELEVAFDSIVPRDAARAVHVVGAPLHNQNIDSLIEFTRTQLFDEHEVMYASKTQVKITDDTITTTVTFEYVDGVLTNANRKLEPTIDPLLQEVLEILGDDGFDDALGVIMKTTSGRVDEHGLEKEFAGMRDTYSEDIPLEILDPLLRDLRVRCDAIRDSKSLSVEDHNVSQMTFQELIELRDML